MMFTFYSCVCMKMMLPVLHLSKHILRISSSYESPSYKCLLSIKFAQECGAIFFKSVDKQNINIQKCFWIRSFVCRNLKKGKSLFSWKISTFKYVFISKHEIEKTKRLPVYQNSKLKILDFPCLCKITIFVVTDFQTFCSTHRDKASKYW